MNRVTFSLHKLDSDSHIDIFFEVPNESKLKTYETEAENWEIFLQGQPIICKQKDDHREFYLSYEGNISNNRGNLQILWQGNYLSQNLVLKKFIKVKLENKSVLIL